MNVFVLMCDQLRYDAVSANGNRNIETPNIDRLAGKSVRFHNAFCQAPLCGPTRHTLATGLYPYEHGVITNSLLPNEPMRTIAHEVRKQGYRAHCFGHMHWQRLPGTEGHVFPDHGYEDYRAITLQDYPVYKAHSNQLMWEHVNSLRTAGVTSLAPSECFGAFVKDESIKQLRECHERGEPFLNWTSFNEPHPPFFAPHAFYSDIDHATLTLPAKDPEGTVLHPQKKNRQGIYPLFNDWDHRRMKAGYYGLVRLVDSYIGELLAEFDRLDLWEDTVIIFTVDHGEMMGDHNLYSKFVFYEAAVHVPMMIYHPNLEPGDCHQLVEHTDIFPTICELTDTPLTAPISGKSLVPLLKDNDRQTWRDYTMSQQGTDVMIRTQRYKLNCYEGEPGELFDLEADPDEFTNLINSKEHRALVDELLAMFDQDHPEFRSKNQSILEKNRVRRKKVKPKITMQQTP